MKRTRFLGIGTTLVVCILALALAVEAGFISVVWAGKPPKTTTSCGYANLTDMAPYVIQSDGRGQYADKNIVGAGGEDKVEITTDTTGALVKSLTILGIVERQSTRRVHFLFDIYSDANISRPGEGMAVYDILVWTDSGKNTRRGNLVNGKYYLNDGTVHFRVIDDIDDVAFIIDPGWDGTNGITQTAVIWSVRFAQQFTA